MADRWDIIGETWSPDPRIRRLRVIAQLMDKPLTVLAVAVAFAAAARVPGLLVAGYTPSGWFVLGLWLSLSIAARLIIVALVARFRARHAIPAPRAD